MLALQAVRLVQPHLSKDVGAQEVVPQPPGAEVILLDRSRWIAHHQCPRRRFLEYEFLGTGIRAPQAAMPLATGSALHLPIEAMLRKAQAGAEVSESEVRDIIATAQAAYREMVAAGFGEGVQSHEVGYVIAEQCALIEGSAWAFWFEVLPWIRDEFEVLEIEKEHDYAARCTCGLGLGVGTLADHAGRGCAGVLLMLRPDFATKRRSDGALGAWDIKSASYPLDRQQHEHSVQMALSCMGVEKDLGEKVQHYYLLGVLKGKRDYPSRERIGLKHQYSVFCYGWMKPGDKSFGIAEEWSSTYTSRKGFSKVPVWEVRFDDQPEGVSSVEWWVREKLTKEQRKGQFDILGPCQRPQHLEQGWLRQASATELEIRGRLELLDQASTVSEDEWVRVLDENFPQSWNCTPYNTMCQFRAVCMGEVGWHELLPSGRYVRREPHHLQEVEQS